MREFDNAAMYNLVRFSRKSKLGQFLSLSLTNLSFDQLKNYQPYYYAI